MSEVVPHNEQKGYKATEAPFSWDKLDGLLAFKSSLTVCSDILNVHEKTIRNHIKKRFNQTFTEYGDRKISRTKVKLVQKALEMATSGNTAMMIFCLKNICNWNDNFDRVIDQQIVLPKNFEFKSIEKPDN